MQQAINHDLTNIVTPVNAEIFKDLLFKSDYDKEKSEFLTNGFKWSFDLGYERKEKVKLTAPNLKLRIGNETILWNKIMKEVERGDMLSFQDYSI